MTTELVRTACTLCGVGCPSLVTVTDGRVIALEPDRQHPRGGAICAKGRAAPEIHDHPHRVNYPLIRTRPKTADEPGWRRCSWDEAMSLVAERLDQIRTESGPQAVAIGRGTGSGTGLSPTEPWLARFAATFGTPNYMTNTHLCQWARDGVSYHTFGVYPMPMPDTASSGCIVLWGSNPSATLLNLATDVVAARTRGARLVVVDPRRIGLANKADILLQVRPGSDGALALAFIDELIRNRWYDEGFVRQWTNGPLLVREDTGRLLTSDAVRSGAVRTAKAPGDAEGDSDTTAIRYVALVQEGALVEYDPASGTYGAGDDVAALRGSVVVPLVDGQQIRCRTAFELLAELAAAYPPEAAAEISGVSATDIRAAVRLIVDNRPVSLHAWNGIVQHTNASQTGRAIELFYALLGDWDRPGGNVVPGRARVRDIAGGATLSAAQAAIRLGRDERPLGPPAAPPGNIAAYDLFDAVLDARPYRIRGLFSIGGNVLLNTADPARGREALSGLEFFAQAEQFETPTSNYADVLLPATTFLENDALVIRNGRAERRRPAVEPLYERRSDAAMIFDLATRLGLGSVFAGGDVVAAYDEVLEPAGLTWAGLLDRPEGVDIVPAPTYEKHARRDEAGRFRGFDTPTRKVELFLDSWAEAGQSPLPAYEEPASSPRRTPELAALFPLVLTNAKKPQFLHSQHRGVAALRRSVPDPTVELHPDTAAEHGIVDGAWVWIETQVARVRARADVTAAITPGVACAYHGWWEACEPMGRDALDPFSEAGANVNMLVRNDVRDPISGAVPNRSGLCRLVPIEAGSHPPDIRSSSTAELPRATA